MIIQLQEQYEARAKLCVISNKEKLVILYKIATPKTKYQWKC